MFDADGRPLDGACNRRATHKHSCKKCSLQGSWQGVLTLPKFDVRNVFIYIEVPFGDYHDRRSIRV